MSLGVLEAARVHRDGDSIQDACLVGYQRTPCSLRGQSQGKTSGDHVTVGMCVSKDSDGRTSELLRSTGLEDSSPAQKGAAHARNPGTLLQETGYGPPAFSESASKA